MIPVHQIVPDPRRFTICAADHNQFHRLEISPELRRLTASGRICSNSALGLALSFKLLGFCQPNLSIPMQSPSAAFRQFTSLQPAVSRPPFQLLTYLPRQRTSLCIRILDQSILCIRAIILSSICWPPTFTAANLQNHRSCVQQKMWDRLSLARRGGAKRRGGGSSSATNRIRRRQRQILSRKAKVRVNSESFWLVTVLEPRLSIR